MTFYICLNESKTIHVLKSGIVHSKSIAGRTPPNQFKLKDLKKPAILIQSRLCKKSVLNGCKFEHFLKSGQTTSKAMILKILLLDCKNKGFEISFICRPI